MQTTLADPKVHADLDLGLFAYLMALSETDDKPDEVARPGDLRRRGGGGFWIFDGEAWVEW